MMSYWKNVAIGFDQLINTLFRGMPDETLSSRAWRHYVDGSRKWPKVIIDALFFFDPDHCKNSYVSEIERNQLKPEMRGKEC